MIKEIADNNGLVTVRGTHPSEVTAFYLARETSNLLRQMGHEVTLITVPYNHSFNYLVDHASNVISKYYELMRHPRELDEIRGHELEEELEEELKNHDPTSSRIETWEDNLTKLFPYSTLNKLRKEHGKKPLIDFHNFRAGSNFGRDLHMTIFTLANDYEGFIRPERYFDNYYTMEIPAFYRKVPQEILERRKEVIDIISRNEDDAPFISHYIDHVADFARSKEEGLVSDEVTRKIAEVIESTVSVD